MPYSNLVFLHLHKYTHEINVTVKYNIVITLFQITIATKCELLASRMNLSCLVGHERAISGLFILSCLLR
jgi:hypothetical protein